MLSSFGEHCLQGRSQPPQVAGAKLKKKKKKVLEGSKLEKNKNK
jgi:hypothetical protein